MLIKLLIAFLKVGFLGFGGGYGMLSLIFEEAIVLGLTVQQFADLNALDMLVPGPIAVNAATYVGYLLGSFAGSAVATLAVTVPSFVYVTFITKIEHLLNTNKAAQKVMEWIKAVVVGVIVGAVFTLVKELIWADGSTNYLAAAIFLASAYLQIKHDYNPIIITIVSGLVSGLVYMIL